MKQLAHSFKQLEHLIQRSERLLLISHKKPDGDTIGATTALARWCRSLDKDLTVFCCDLPSKQYQYLDETRYYTKDPAVFSEQYDVVAVIDSGDFKYAGIDLLIPNLKPGYTLVDIDHHQTNQCYGDLNLVSPTASSTCEVVYSFFIENGIDIDGEMATSLLTGLCSDTSNFSNPLTSESAMYAASDLVARGARFTDTLRYLWKNKTFDGLKAWGTVLSRLSYNPTHDIATTYLLEEDMANVPAEGYDTLINFLSGVMKDVDTIMFIKQYPNNLIRGSFRGHKRDVSKLAKLFGGGGHKGAAGFSVTGRIEIGGDGSVRIEAV